MSRPYQVLTAVLFCLVPFLSADRLQSAEWAHDFHLRDFMRIYSFPEELVSYRVEFPPRTVRRDELRLVALHRPEPRSAVFQLSDVTERDGFLHAATVSFRTDLPKEATRRFRLEYDPQARPSRTSRGGVGLTERRDGMAVLKSNLLRLRVPFGRQQFEQPVPPSQVAAPLLAMARGERPDDWCLAGSFADGSSLKVIAMDAGPLEEGPLFGRYRVRYTFDRGQQYTVELTVRQHERYVTVDESLGGLAPHDEAYLRIDLKPGLNPDHREVMSNGGYGAQGYCGAYDKDIDTSGRLPFQLGIYRPNSLGVMRSAAFYRDKGPHSLLVSVYRLRDWKTAYRHVWYGNSGPGNLNFYASGGEKYLQTRLEGAQRHWALALIPREDQKHLRITPGNRGRGQAGGPEVRLWQKLADFSLDRVKDWVFEWDERSDAHVFPEGRSIDYSQWQKSYGMESPWWFLNAIVNYYWDFSAEVGPPSYGLMPGFFGDYERSRADWTEEERRHVRAILLFLAYTAEDDNNLPHHSMLGGQPNFVMQVKQTLAIACGVFPDHPHAPRWRDSFVKFYREWLETYGRERDSEHNALGGRWTENIACYSGTSLQALLRCARALKMYDGTDLLAHPQLHAWIRWYLNSLMSPHNGVRRVPPEGAHAGAFAVGGDYWQALFEIARRIEPSAPELSAHMRWLETGGKEGRRPRLESVLVRDYGPVLRYDFGGPHEAYLHLMQTAGRYNYRWGPGSGVLYYGARNRNWSHNGPEDNGDQFNINCVSSFSVGGQSLGHHPTDQPLYNFEFAQFYRAVADPDVATKTGYRSRGIMLLRDDYLVVYDDVDTGTEGQFTWSGGDAVPFIAQLKPGVPPDEESTDRVRRFRGRGDFLTLVAPEPLETKPRPYGALIKGKEHVLYRDEGIRHAEDSLHFEGSVGYARPQQLGLFEGTRLALGEFAISRSGGDFGFSAEVAAEKQITGHIAGRQGGKLIIRPPWQVAPGRVHVTLDGKPVSAVVANGAVQFDADISLGDGYRSFTIRGE